MWSLLKCLSLPCNTDFIETRLKTGTYIKYKYTKDFFYIAHFIQCHISNLSLSFSIPTMLSIENTLGLATKIPVIFAAGALHHVAFTSPNPPASSERKIGNFVDKTLFASIAFVTIGQKVPTFLSTRYPKLKLTRICFRL
jgi:hypothetical protein